MVRTIITPQQKSISLEIPAVYIGREVEIIAFAKDEGVESMISIYKEASFSAVSIDTRKYIFNRNEANER